MSEKKSFLGGLFGKKKKGSCCNIEITEEKECDCNNDSCEEVHSKNGKVSKISSSDGKFIIKVVGTGCSKCNKLTENATQAIDEMGVEAQIIKITDMMDIVATGIIQTPGLMINENIVATGKVLSVNEIKALFEK